MEKNVVEDEIFRIKDEGVSRNPLTETIRTKLFSKFLFSSKMFLLRFWQPKNDLSTDRHFQGKDLRLKTKNQYFCVVDKNAKIGEVANCICDFRELEQAIKIRNYNPEKDVLLRLEFQDDKSYFVESYQAITVKDPDFTVVNIPFQELRQITPQFEPFPRG